MLGTDLLVAAYPEPDDNQERMIEEALDYTADAISDQFTEGDGENEEMDEDEEGV